MNKVKISDIAQLQFGLYSKSSDEGDVKYLHAKHFDDSGILVEEIDTLLTKDDKNESHLLQDGDVLFVGKGFRNFAWTYTTSIGKAIASSIFFVIRPNQSIAFPEFIATLFNTAKYQAYFQSMGAGSKITSIRKSELEAVTINLPDLETQKIIVELKRLHQRDMVLSKEIIEEKEIRFQSVINQLLNI